MGNNNNRYDDEFKASAVKMVVEKGRPISAVAKDLGISQPALRRWVKLNNGPENEPFSDFWTLFREHTLELHKV